MPPRQGVVDKGGGSGKSCIPISARGSLLLPLIDGGRHKKRKQGVSSALKKIHHCPLVQSGLLFDRCESFVQREGVAATVTGQDSHPGSLAPKNCLLLVWSSVLGGKKRVV